MYSIQCPSCKHDWNLEYAAYTKARDAGSVREVKIDTSHTIYSGLCIHCQRRDIQASLSFRDQIDQIRNLSLDMAQKLECTWAEAVPAAIEKLFDPRREKDAGFRAYLLDNGVNS